MKKIISLFIVLISLPFSIFSYSPKLQWLGSEDTFRVDPVTDGILLGTGAALNGTALLMDKVFDYNNIPFITPPSKDEINGFDRYFMNDYSKPLDITADALQYLAFATPLLFCATNLKEMPTVAIMYIETLMLSKGTVDTLKTLAGRTRPGMYYENYPQQLVEEMDWNKSWPSGHTTYTFATAAFLTYTFAKYNPESPWTYVIAGTSYAIALTTGTLRVLSGNHFVTDVLTGALIGTAYGFLVPWLHTINVNNNSNLTVTPAGLSYSIKL